MSFSGCSRDAQEDYSPKKEKKWNSVSYYYSMLEGPKRNKNAADVQGIM
jgi:hypothetical protein